MTASSPKRPTVAEPTARLAKARRTHDVTVADRLLNPQRTIEGIVRPLCSASAD